MKTALFWAVLLCFSFSLQTQASARNGSIGITFSGFGENDTFRWESLDGVGSFFGTGYYSLGITYRRALSRRFDIETGIEFSNLTYYFTHSMAAPKPYSVNLSMFKIPVTVRYSFLRFFFINGGLLLGFDVTDERHLDNQTGLGATLGVGIKYNFSFLPIGVFVNPFVRHHSIIPFFSESNYQLHAWENGFRIGVVYNF